MLEILALPSNEATPKLVALWLMAIDCICENLPRSEDSMRVREFWLLMSMSIIFSLEVPATRVGNWKSLVKILFSALTVITGVGLPCCQIWA